MFKKYRWLILISLIIIGIVLFIIFARDYKQSDNIDNDLSFIKDKKWYITSLSISEDGEEFFKNDSYAFKYIIFDDKTIKFCDSNSNECKKDNYTYTNDMISIETLNTIGKGNYTIEYTDVELTLSRNEGKRKTVYTFTLPVG